MTPDFCVREIFQVEGKTKKKLMGNDDKVKYTLMFRKCSTTRSV